MTSKQVDKSHYTFQNYVDIRRWATIWYQLRETLEDQPECVLEVGPGPGLFSSSLRSLGIGTDTIDIDLELRPTIAASVTSLPLMDESYDTVCAFQILEHLPYEISLLAFTELSRVAKRKVIISLPDAKKGWPYTIALPFIGELKGYIPRFWHHPKDHIFNGEHFWELNKKLYPTKRVLSDLADSTNLRFARSFKCPESPRHAFFIFLRD